MGRYIDADKLVQVLKEEQSKRGTLRDYEIGYWNALTMAQAIVLSQPTADVVEVKHGRWIEDGYYEKPCVCSCCGEEAKYISSFEETFDYDKEENLQSTGYEEIREYIRTPYCPNCGAEMDKKE